MERKKRIEKILSNNFKLWLVEVQDVSLDHKDHNNFDGYGESHFSIVLRQKVKEKFTRIEIHKKVNELLKNEFLSGLHALEIKINN